MIDQLLKEIAAFGQPSGELWFRGQADASWILAPTLIRAGLSRELEKSMLARFRYRAMGMVDSPPADNDPARWSFLMQHYGLPTRLMDWSESALAALFFAVTERRDADGRLHILVPMALNAQQVGRRVLLPPTGNPSDEILRGSFLGTEMPPKTVAIAAYASNDRLARQRGGFTVHGLATDLAEVVGSNPAILRSILIPSGVKRELAESLAHLGVTRTTLFHDLDSLAREIREQYGLS